jgi:hypothetical protein
MQKLAVQHAVLWEYPNDRSPGIIGGTWEGTVFGSPHHDQPCKVCRGSLKPRSRRGRPRRVPEENAQVGCGNDRLTQLYGCG